MNTSNQVNTVLIVDADAASVQSIEQILVMEGFKVSIVSDGKEAIRIAREVEPKLIILEISLPGIDGIETCVELKGIESLKNTIIVFYTSRNEDYSQIAAFNAGADDFIAKPVRPKVLMARIKALLKRYDHTPVEVDNSSAKNNVSGIVIDRERYLVFKEGKEIVLPRKEFELFSLLHSSPRKVFTRGEISHLIWGYEMLSHNRTIDVHVRKLREKVGDRHIRTIKGIGYCFEL